MNGAVCRILRAPEMPCQDMFTKLSRNSPEMHEIAIEVLYSKQNQLNLRPDETTEIHKLQIVNAVLFLSISRKKTSLLILTC